MTVRQRDLPTPQPWYYSMESSTAITLSSVAFETATLYTKSIPLQLLAASLAIPLGIYLGKKIHQLAINHHLDEEITEAISATISLLALTVLLRKTIF